MHEDRPRRGRTMCFDCKYPLIRLDNFDGDSSLDAPAFGDRSIGAGPNLRWGLWLLPWHLAKSLWCGGKTQNRHKQVAKLREDILPSEPEAMICPMCLRVFFPDELRG